MKKIISFHEFLCRRLGIADYVLEKSVSDRINDFINELYEDGTVERWKQERPTGKNAEAGKKGRPLGSKQEMQAWTI